MEILTHKQVLKKVEGLMSEIRHAMCDLELKTIIDRHTLGVINDVDVTEHTDLEDDYMLLFNMLDEMYQIGK